MSLLLPFFLSPFEIQEAEIDALRGQLHGLKEFAVERDDMVMALATTKARLEQVTAAQTRAAAQMREKHADSRVRGGEGLLVAVGFF